MSSYINDTVWTDARRPVRIRVWDHAGISEHLLLVKQVSGIETICGGLEYSVLCVARQAGMALKRFIGNAIELQFITDSGGLRSVCGIVTAAAEGHGDGALASYQLTVRDALSLLDKTCNTRVFRDASEIAITEILLEEWRLNMPALAGMFHYDLRHLQSYPARAFTMQYNESTAAFLRRLWKRRGIGWFMRPGTATGEASDTPVHTLVLFDEYWVLKKNAAGTVRFHREGATEDRDTITAWQPVRTLTSGKVNRRSWDYAGARMMVSEEKNTRDQGLVGNHLAAGLDDYLIDAPHTGDNDEDYCLLGRLRVERHGYEAKFFRGEGNDRNMCVGQWIGLAKHPEIDTHPPEEREFVITELQVEADNNLPGALDEQVRRLFALNHWSSGGPPRQADAAPGGRYRTRFTCVRRGIPIVPAYDPRIDLPRTHLQYVTVVGPVNDEIHCDKLGRVKIRFPGCREEDHAHAYGAGASDSERDSAWVQVASPWAGAQYGSIALPRVGHQVLCDFVGGDPDKPLIVGRAHGGLTPPPSFSRVSRLPGDKYLSGIVSKEGAGQGYNQLRLDDTPGQISAQLASAHGQSQLNLGFLTHPRRAGQAAARGAGFELATDDSGAIRTAKSLLISAWKRLEACGEQLSSEEHLALMQDCLDLFKSLGQYAAEHHGLPADPAPQAELKSHLDAAQDGQPTLSVTAPAGIAFSTPKTIVTYGGVNIDSVAQRHMQLASGQRCSLNAGAGISLFSHTDGITQVAHKGKFVMQSQHDDMGLDAARDLKVTAGKRMIFMAEEEVSFIVSGGAYLKLKGGAVEIGGPGALTIKTDGHHWNGPASGKTELPTFGERDFGRIPRLLRATDGKPVEGMKAHVERSGDSPLSGQTNGAGEADKITVDHVQQLTATFYKPLA